MIRRIARELVLQSLFQIDFAQVDCEAALKLLLKNGLIKVLKKPKSMHRMF